MMHKVTWIDMEREPKVKPNPLYPNGIDVDMSQGAVVACLVTLPYPAKRIGTYVIDCQKCKLRVALTTAGRPDDPRSVKLACKKKGAL
jgi:hypothetical protein